MVANYKMGFSTKLSIIKSLLIVLVIIFFVNDGFSSVISGTARYIHNNEPVQSGTVEMMRIDDVTGDPILLGVCVLQSDGQYSFTINTSDSIYAIIYPSDLDPEIDFIPTYYPNKTNWENANFIIPTSSYMDVDIYCEYTGEAPIIPTFNAYTISGKVNSSNFDGISRATIIVKQDGIAFTHTLTDKQGNYSINVPPGEFEVCTDKLGYVSESKPITAAGSNDENIHLDFSISKPGEDNFINTTPVNFSLSQNYPNPFNPTTTIEFVTPVNGNVTLQVFDLSGKEVDVLINEYRTEGSYKVNFGGENYSSGVYFYKLTVNNFTDTKKMLLVK